MNLITVEAFFFFSYLEREFYSFGKFFDVIKKEQSILKLELFIFRLAKKF